MSECKAKVVVEICAETALDAVSKRVVKGMKVLTACKEVAEEFNKDNDAVIKANTLRQSYTRAQKTATCSKIKKDKVLHVAKLDVPIVDSSTTITTKCTDCFAMETEVAVLKLRVEELIEQINLLNIELDKHLPEAPLSPQTTKTIPRQLAYSYIEKFGNPFQVVALKGKLPNPQMYKILKVVIEERLRHVPHSGVPKDILEAKEIV